MAVTATRVVRLGREPYRVLRSLAQVKGKPLTQCLAEAVESWEEAQPGSVRLGAENLRRLQKCPQPEEGR